MNGQQLQDAAAELPDNEIQLSDEVTKSSGGWNNGEPGLVERGDACRIYLRRESSRFVRAELPYEGIVDVFAQQVSAGSTLTAVLAPDGHTG